MNCESIIRSVVASSDIDVSSKTKEIIQSKTGDAEMFIRWIKETYEKHGIKNFDLKGIGNADNKQLTLVFESTTEQKVNIEDFIQATGKTFFIHVPEGKGSDKDKIRYIVRNKLFKKNYVDYKKLGSSQFEVMLEEEARIAIDMFDQNFYKDITAIMTKRFLKNEPVQGDWEVVLVKKFNKWKDDDELNFD